MHIKPLSLLTTAEVEQLAHAAAERGETAEASNVFPVNSPGHRYFQNFHAERARSLEAVAAGAQLHFLTLKHQGFAFHQFKNSYRDDNTMPSDNDDNHSLMFARAGIANPMGKLEDELKTKVDSETFMAFRRLVNEAGTDTAGALRDWVFLKVHGKTFTDMCRDAEKVNRDKLFGTGHDEGLLCSKVLGDLHTGAQRS